MDGRSPADAGMRRFLLSLAAAAFALSSVGEAAECTVRPSAGGPPREAYLRSETLSVEVAGLPATALPGRDRVRVRLESGGRTVIEAAGRPVAAGAGGRVSAPLGLAALRAGRYDLVCDGAGASCTAAVWVCREPPREGFDLVMLAEGPWQGAALDERLERLARVGMSGVMFYVLTPAEMDRCLVHGLSAMGLSHGNAARAGYRETPGTNVRLNAAGKPFAGAPRSIADPAWQRASAADLGQVVKSSLPYPAYAPVVCTSDDFFRWTGLDYHPANVARFSQLAGGEPPRPPEALAADVPRTVRRAKGIIPDDEPWVIWQRLLSLDVLGGYNRLLSRAVAEATGGRGAVGPVSGGGPGAMGIVPYVDAASGQWPPFNFGANGFSLLCSYNYNFYWFPALAQVWWQELGRMGNRGLRQWVMPDTMDRRLSYHLNNGWLFMASGVDGLDYFIFERTTPAAWSALEQAGRFIGPRRELLAALEPAGRTVGLLVPFENACFRADAVPDASYAFGNLLMAHADVEPVLPEELPEERPECRVVLLHDVDWLSAASRDRLRRFIRRGGAVACDAMTEVEIPGAVRLDFPLGSPGRREGYGLAEQVAKVRDFVADVAPPWAACDDPRLLVRRFRAGGIDYLWLVHVMSREEDLAHVPAAGEDRTRELRPEYAGFTARRVAARLSVACPPGRTAFDVPSGRRLPARDEGGRLVVDAEVGMWQGTLVALYPQVPDRVEVRAPERAAAGRSVVSDVLVTAGGRRLDVDVPIAVDIVEPGGAVSGEYSFTAMARRGYCRFTVPFAVNDPAGSWEIRARETTVGAGAAASVRLLPPP